MFYITQSTNNSLFSVMLYPDHKFLISDKLQLAIRARHPDGEAADVGISLYFVINDALTFPRLWNQLGVREDTLFRCRQGIHNVGERISGCNYKPALRDMRELVLILNQQLAILELLINDPFLSLFRLKLFVPEEIQKALEIIYARAASTVAGSKDMDMRMVEGCSRALMRNAPNVLTEKDITQLHSYLCKDKGAAVITEICAKYLGSLSSDKLKYINMKKLMQEFINSNPVAIDIVVKLYLLHCGIPVIYKI